MCEQVVNFRVLEMAGNYAGYLSNCQFVTVLRVHSHAEKSVGGFFLSPEPEVK
jgi:hypothetical protein